MQPHLTMGTRAENCTKSAHLLLFGPLRAENHENSARKVNFRPFRADFRQISAREPFPTIKPTINYDDFPFPEQLGISCTLARR